MGTTTLMLLLIKLVSTQNISTLHIILQKLAIFEISKHMYSYLYEGQLFRSAL